MGRHRTGTVIGCLRRLQGSHSLRPPTTPSLFRPLRHERTPDMLTEEGGGVFVSAGIYQARSKSTGASRGVGEIDWRTNCRLSILIRGSSRFQRIGRNGCGLMTRRKKRKEKTLYHFSLFKLWEALFFHLFCSFIREDNLYKEKKRKEKKTNLLNLILFFFIIIAPTGPQGRPPPLQSPQWYPAAQYTLAALSSRSPAFPRRSATRRG